MGPMRNAYESCFLSLKETGHSRNLGVGKGIRLKWILRQQSRRAFTGLIWLRMATDDWLF
jgi:hypothetical protein